MHIPQMLQLDVKQILADAQEHSAYTALHKEDIQACAALTQSLEAVASASSALETAEEAILSSDLSQACEALVCHKLRLTHESLKLTHTAFFLEYYANKNGGTSQSSTRDWRRRCLPGKITT